MPTWLNEREMTEVAPAERRAFQSPVPTQVVSNGEYNPLPQTPKQRQVEARIVELASTYSQRLSMRRREFLRTASGMAAAFLAMNHVYGPMFEVSEAEAADPDSASERVARLSQQLIFDDQLHFVRDDYKYEGLLDLGRFAAKHWNSSMLKERGIE